MTLISNENGKTVYGCARCPVTFQHGQNRYGNGRYVGEKLYCNSCADDISPRSITISSDDLKPHYCS
ncbi:hypothetical protein P3T33_000835 [Rhizobium sp. AN67]|nr:hypothetical protein [Rhizobium sp. AN67]SOD59793.1 hypothetical protein SAMN05216595_4956 [Rhizobium sp. AN6A]